MKHPIPLIRPGRETRVVNALARWNEPLTADELHEKYKKMNASAFVFFRGSNHLYWADFANDWHLNRFGNVRTRTWLQGDAHAENLGAFNDQEGNLVYGLNDFDESFVGDYQYDLWRFAVSLVLIARDARIERKADFVDALSDSYLDAMGEFAKMEPDAFPEKYVTIDHSTGLLGDFMRKTSEDKSRKKMLKKWTAKTEDGQRKFDFTSSKLDEASEWETSDILAAMPDYIKTLTNNSWYSNNYFKVMDIARRLSAGTGSLGTPRYYVLIEGKGDSWKDNHILDIKRQSFPSAYHYLSQEEQIDHDRRFDNEAKRQAVAYHSLGTQPDVFMGWMKLHNGYYSVRERSPFKETFPTEELTTLDGFVEMAKTWARILAAYHHCAVRNLRIDEDSYSIAKEVVKLTDKGHRGRDDFRALVRDVAFEYANLVEDDHESFRKAFKPDS